MSIETVTPPALEPVSLAEAKARLRVTTTDEDDAITAMIAAARAQVETLTGRALVTRRVREVRDDWFAGARLSRCGAVYRLGLGPVAQVHHVKTYDDDGAEKTWAGSDYYVDHISAPGRIGLVGGAVWPAPGRAIAGVEIEYDAGYGAAASDVPEALREAIHLLIAERFEHRLASDRPEETTIPLAVQALVAPFQRGRL